VPIIRLTDLGLLNLAPPPKLTDYWDATLPTFGVRVSPKGTKTFVLKTRNGGGRHAIGRYPIIKLSEAREEAKRILAERTLGKLRPQSITYPQAVRLFVEDKRQNRPKSADQYEWFLTRLGFTGQLSAIYQADIERELKKIKSRSTYDHVLVAARILFNWAHRRRYVAENPTFGIARPSSQSRARVLSDAELKKIWEATEGTYGAIVRLLITTGQRRGEIAALQSSWVQNSTITFPKEITKNGKQHTVPVGKLSTENLGTLTSYTGCLFPARGKPDQPFNGWSKAKEQLDKLSGVTDWTLHDLRRTFATRLAEMGVAPHVVERLLNHSTGTISGAAAVYNRAKYLEEMREAVNLWERNLSTIIKSA
jgi:integrase